MYQSNFQHSYLIFESGFHTNGKLINSPKDQFFLLKSVQCFIFASDCPALTPPTNGAIDSTAVSQQTQVNVNCSDTYTLFGADLLICQSNAAWDNVMPECRLGKNAG